MRDDAEALTGQGPNDFRRVVRGADTAAERLQIDNSMLMGTAAAAIRDEIDGPAARAHWQKLVGHYMRELKAQSSWRQKMLEDEGMYDGTRHWTAEEADKIRDRGQEPMVFNVTMQAVNWVTGSEKRARTDYKVLPRTKSGSKAAERKSQVLKYVSDANRTPFDWSRTFTEMIQAGLSFMESGVQDDDDGEPIMERQVSWRDMIIDSAATKPDLSDSRYMFRHKWVDLDVAIAMFPNRKTTLETASSDMFDYVGQGDALGDEAMDARENLINTRPIGADIDILGATRRRLRLIEGWFRIPMQDLRMRGGQFNGELYDPASRGHIADISAGKAKVRKKLTYRMFVMLFCSSGPLWMSPSPYRHNKFPFTPLWGNREADTGAPFGLIRNMRDIQRDINKRMSKAQHILNTNKVIMDKGAVDDLDEFAEEVHRPDAIIVKKPGAFLEINAEKELAATHYDIMQGDVAMLQSLSGVTDENMGRETNAKSGKAIIARQDQGALTTAHYFDNLRFAKIVHGEKVLSVIEQFMSDEKEFRITNARGVAQHVTVNSGDDDDITTTKADFTISEDDWHATYRQAQAAMLLDVITNLASAAPQLVMVMLDLVIETMDIPNRDEIVKRIRQITDMEDPDADPNEVTPEKLAKEKAKAEAAAMQQRAAEAEVSKMEGEAASKQAQAQKTLADAEKARNSLTKDKIDAITAALQAAITALQAPAAAPVADVILEEAGGTAPSTRIAPRPVSVRSPAQAGVAPAGPPPMLPSPPQGA